MQNSFSVSVNILRDSSRPINYLVTPNGQKVISQIVNDYNLGLRAFNIIGAYGTGKSSLLWAIQQTLSKKAHYFEMGWMETSKVSFINIVGEYRSLRSVLADYFKIDSLNGVEENILKNLLITYQNLGTENPLLVIQIDEFGKFLEYSAENNPEEDLYFLQKLTEFISDPRLNILLLTTVHQNFEAYSFELNSVQRQEWNKVSGRFREVAFNEPVEQLLWLAASFTNNQVLTSSDSTSIKKLLSLYQKSSAFGNTNTGILEISSKIFPLDIFSASVLTLALQRYGQNERSLFTFLNSVDTNFIKINPSLESPFFNLEDVYDYLVNHFYTFLNSRANPDYIAWQSIKTALERVESLNGHEIKLLKQIIKTIGLLNIFSSASALLDNHFIKSYAQICFEIKSVDPLIKTLAQQKIILYRNYSHRYILFDGTDLDIHSALDNAANKVTPITDISSLIKKYLDLSPVLAKEITFKLGTPRIFEYKISQYPIHETPEDEVDGYINLIFNERLSIEELMEESKHEDEAIIYCFFKNAKVVRDSLFEIEKVQSVLIENQDDKVAVKELQNILLHQKNYLQHKLLKSYFECDFVEWVHKGEKVEITNKKSLNKALTRICIDVYNLTPKFRNELVNRHKISGSIHSAKRQYFKALVNNYESNDLGFTENKFPPEKTIYLSMLRENCIYPNKFSESGQTSISETSGFRKLWEVLDEFLNSSRHGRKRISDLYETLSHRPFKLKRGFLDFLVPTFLFLNRENFALFTKGSFLPELSSETLELLTKSPMDYEVKKFDVDGVRYEVFNGFRRFLKQEQGVEVTNSNFISTLKPFFVFYKSLPEYAKNTKRLRKETLAIRNVLVTAEDPEKVFFEEFPSALGFSLEQLHESGSNLEAFLEKLQTSVRELRSCYEELVERFESFILEEIIGDRVPFNDYKTLLQSRFKNIKHALLLREQKVFLQRIESQLENREAWLNSLGSALLGKSLEKFTDNDEIYLQSKMKEMVLDLDSLTELSQEDFDLENEKVVKLDVSSSNSKRHSKTIRVPNHGVQKIEEIKMRIKNSLDNDKVSNLTALITLLTELLENEEN